MGITAEQGWMLLLFIAADFALAGIGSRLGVRGHGTEVWYASLRKPPSHPPAWLSAAIWTLVGICTGVAGWLIWLQTRLGYPETALVLWGFQLLFNALWQGVAVGARRLGWGVAQGFLLWGTITLTAWEAAAAPGVAWAWLLPYWLWTGYGVRLNFQLWRLNRPPAPAEASSV